MIPLKTCLKILWFCYLQPWKAQNRNIDSWVPPPPPVLKSVGDSITGMVDNVRNVGFKDISSKMFKATYLKKKPLLHRMVWRGWFLGYYVAG